MAGVSPDALVDLDLGNTVEPVRVLDEHSAALGQERRVRCVPRHPQTLRDPKADEGGVRQVGFFRMGGVGISIIGNLDPYPATHAPAMLTGPDYILDCDET